MSLGLKLPIFYTLLSSAKRISCLCVVTLHSSIAERNFSQPWHLICRFAPLPIGMRGITSRQHTSAGASSSWLPAIHDRRPLALLPATERKWLNTNFVPPFGHMLADVYSLQTEDFAWQPVSVAVGAVRNYHPSIIMAIDTPTVRAPLYHESIQGVIIRMRMTPLSKKTVC